MTINTESLKFVVIYNFCQKKNVILENKDIQDNCMSRILLLGNYSFSKCVCFLLFRSLCNGSPSMPCSLPVLHFKWGTLLSVISAFWRHGTGRTVQHSQLFTSYFNDCPCYRLEGIYLLNYSLGNKEKQTNLRVKPVWQGMELYQYFQRQWERGKFRQHSTTMKSESLQYLTALVNFYLKNSQHEKLTQLLEFNFLCLL